MKKKNSKIVVGFLIIFFISTFFGYSRYGNRGEMMLSIIESMPKEELNADEKTMILKMREEEKLAKDVYLRLYELWGDVIFKNISLSEQMHTNAVKVLIDKYGLNDPYVDEVGKFSTKELQDLYNLLVEKGSKSLVDALYVGATIEDLDIFDLQKEMLKADNMDILFVFENLKKGSENHMRAFVSRLNMFSVEYKAQYISQEELEIILSSSNSNGNGRRGRGRRGRW